MPSRRDIFTNGKIYHLYNKTIDDKRIFISSKNAQRYLSLISYYRSQKATLRYSHFKELEQTLKRKMLRELSFKKYFKVNILSYCLMPTHFHLLVKQFKNSGIVRFITDVTNAFTRYFNVKHKRKGPLFLTQFKSRIIRSREQLIHVSRYIHLNPYSSGIVKNIHQLPSYPWSSYPDFLYEKDKFLCDTSIILDEFNQDRIKYKSFVTSNANYQQTLENIKYLERWL